VSRLSAGSILALLLVVPLSQALAVEASQAALLAQARITEGEATRTALAKVPGGVVKSFELEREGGRLVWSFDISRPSRPGVIEIQVDALSGRIVSVKKESAADEAREARAEAKGK
jgi:uncharacterized membrane protein YkoI